MEKIMIASVIAVICFWINGKPWVTPHETGPVNQLPTLEKPAYNSKPAPCKDLTKAIPNTPGIS